jgi:subtilisin-like proprotein convertase family protein
MLLAALLAGTQAPIAFSATLDSDNSLAMEREIDTAFKYASDLSRYRVQDVIESGSWVLNLDPDASASQLASVLGAQNLVPTDLIPYTYIYTLPSGTNRANIGHDIQSLAGVRYAYPLVGHDFEPMYVPNDTLYSQQWHLHNTGQSGGVPGQDANLEAAWDVTKGTGVVIGVVDTGTQYTHPDLIGHYLPNLALDIVDGDNDPAPAFPPDPFNEEFHGTAVAGVATANTDNNLGTSGAAPDARFTAIRFLGGFPTDAQEAQTFTHQNQAIQVYNHSWGPGQHYVAPGPLAVAALQQGAFTGRAGKGSVQMFANANGDEEFDNGNYNGYANSWYTNAIGAIDDRGVRAYYSTRGANLLVSTYSLGGNAGIVTTDITGADGYNVDSTDDDLLPDTNYTSTFSGTSSATPLASGIVALMLSANPNLTWRDVQSILVHTAVKNDPTNPNWTTNGAGLHINDEYGFGSIDAAAAVNAAKTWTNLPTPTILSSQTFNVNQALPDDGGDGLITTLDVQNDFKVEQVELVVDITHDYPEDLDIILTSPDGTESVLSRAHTETTNFFTQDVLKGWSFRSTRHWDELAKGTWTITVIDRNPGDAGFFNSFNLNFIGVDTTTQPNAGAKIEGFVLDDTNGNATFDAGESGLNAALVYIDANANNTFDAGEVSDYTDTAGHYIFTGLAAGNYNVRVSPNPVQTQTFPAAPGTIVATVTAGQTLSGQNFAIRPGATANAPFYLSNMPGDASVKVGVDGYGSFGWAVADGDDAIFDPLGSIAAAGTTYQSMVAVGPALGHRTFLSSEYLPTSPLVTGGPSLGTSDFVYNNLLFHLTQSLQTLNNAAGVRIGSRLVQTYTITNIGLLAQTFDMVRYFDGDLDFDGSIDDGGGRLTVNGNEIMFEIDSATGRYDPTTFVGITATGGTPSANRYEADYFPYLRHQVIAGTNLDQVIENDGPDPDQFVDAGQGYDITLALANIFNLAPGEVGVYTTSTLFGTGTPDETVEVPPAAPPPPPPFQFSGVVKNDLNNNGLNDPGEPGLAGAIVYIDLNNDNQLGLGEPAQVTNSQGQYSFQVREGTYTVRQVQLAGWVPTYPASGYYEVTGTSGESISNLFFGNNAQTDWGDAPASYGTLSASGGASHSILSGFYLGSSIDGEGDGQPSSQANGDDNASFDDDDGVTFTSSIVAGQTSNVDVLVHNGGRGSGLLNAWIDFNHNGTFEDNEHIFRNKNVVDGVNHLSFTVPSTALLGSTFARFRYGYGTGPNGNGVLPTGPVLGGEVEDYVVSLIGLKPQATPDTFHIVHDTTNNVLNVLANDIASTLGPITITNVSAGSLGGQIVLKPDQTIGYTPKPGVLSGTETFTYVINDFKGGIATGTVTITIGDPIIPPVANDDQFTVPMNAVSYNLDVRANDITSGAAVTGITVKQATSKGGYVAVNAGTFTIRYTAPFNYVGVDQFEYTLRDALGFETKAIATVHVGFDSANDLTGISLAVTDTNGTAITSVPVGTEFQLRILVTDKRNAPVDPGVVAAYLDVLYSNGLVTPKTAANAYGLDVSFPAAFDTSLSASAPQPGLINEIGASRSSAPSGAGPDLLAIVTFVASATGTANFTADPADIPINHDVLMGSPAFTVGVDNVTFGKTSINVVPAVPIQTQKFKNGSNAFDVNGDGVVTPLDALYIINDLNSRGPMALLGRALNLSARYVDVSGDSYLTALDALLVVNYLNSRTNGEGEAPVSSPMNQYDPAWFDASSDDEEDDLLELLAEER